jgi:spore maturation protein CgeB
VAESGDAVAEHVRALTPARSHTIGEAALRRVLAEHTYAHRAAEVELVLGGRWEVGAGRTHRAPQPVEIT